jgi:hypothetical protein
VKDPPPPAPTASLSKSGPPIACGTGGGGCHRVGVSYADLPNGNYNVDILRGGSPIGTTMNMTVGGSGSFVHVNHLGVMVNDTVSVRFYNTANGQSYTLGTISGAAWDAM